MKQLIGKMAIITGASEGLGRSLALAFAKKYLWHEFGDLNLII
jgi:NAD(P)-dependent dehydrogenase (short-subunit alcohol dehydrogenase family)